jgi:hypothetical protein
MDREIHCGYKLFPCNYIAADLLEGKQERTSHYTPADVERFEKYVDGQIAKITIPGKDVPFLRERILTMYANPMYNHIAARQ